MLGQRRLISPQIWPTFTPASSGLHNSVIINRYKKGMGAHPVLCVCGAEYRLEHHKRAARGTGSIECRVCQETLADWGGLDAWTAEPIGLRAALIETMFSERQAGQPALHDRGSQRTLFT